MSHPESDLPPPVAEVLATARTCVDTYGGGAAETDLSVENGISIITVRPYQDGAASVTIRMAENESILLTFGKTSVALVEDQPERLENLRSTLELVMKGSFVEFGPGHGQAQFQLAGGSQVLLGNQKSPLQRRFGPKKRYQPYV